MVKIDCVEKLPDWFILDKYNGSEKFNAMQWSEHLLYRKKMLEFIPYFPLFKSVEESSSNYALANDLINKLKMLRDSPLHPYGHNRFISVATDRRIQAINPVYFSDLKLLAMRNEKKLIDDQKPKFLTNRNNELTPTPTLYRAGPTDKTDMINHLISVNLNATDSILIESFKLWLKTTRKRSPTISKRNLPAYKNWSNYGILPYLDLLIWSKETNQHIPHHVLSEAVSRRNMSESAFTKTVAQLACSLMTDPSELHALAIHEESIE